MKTLLCAAAALVLLTCCGLTTRARPKPKNPTSDTPATPGSTFSRFMLPTILSTRPALRTVVVSAPDTTSASPTSSTKATTACLGENPPITPLNRPSSTCTCNGAVAKAIKADAADIVAEIVSLYLGLASGHVSFF
jgi:hypothetical protein